MGILNTGFQVSLTPTLNTPTGQAGTATTNPTFSQPLSLDQSHFTDPNAVVVSIQPPIITGGAPSEAETVRLLQGVTFQPLQPQFAQSYNYPWNNPLNGVVAGVSFPPALTVAATVHNSPATGTIPAADVATGQTAHGSTVTAHALTATVTNTAAALTGALATRYFPPIIKPVTPTTSDVKDPNGLSVGPLNPGQLSVMSQATGAVDLFRAMGATNIFYNMIVDAAPTTGPFRVNYTDDRRLLEIGNAASGALNVGLIAYQLALGDDLGTQQLVLDRLARDAKYARPKSEDA